MAGSWRTALRRRWQARVRPLMARRAFKRLLENPDETEHVFVLIRALSGRSFERLMRRVRKDPMGAQIIRERRNLMPLLTNREYLLGLSQETLGHQYCRFTLAEQISAEGLADASLVMRGAEDKPLRNEDFDAEAFGERLRDMHDLWHVVTGYSRDILGELALLAFTYEQTREPGIGYIVRNVERRIRKGDDGEVSEFLREASARGRDATLLPAADWESLLERPLEEVREQLRLGPPPEYEQRRTPSGETAVAAAGA